MSVLSLTHATVYRYRSPVSFGEHRLMFRPRDSHDLRLLDTGLEISPPANVRWYHDIFGNSIAVAAFDAEAAELRLVSTIRLEHFAPAEPEFSVAPHARTYPFSYSAEEVPDLGRTIERHYPDPDHRVDEWVRALIKANGDTNTMDMLLAINAAIQKGFRYVRRNSEGTQTPVETLTLGKGSCRDYALFMMEVVRSLGFAARFVSGYLYDAKLVGAPGSSVGGGATHAWMQIYLPGAGWVEFDPTNGLVGGTNLVRVAVARDPSQAVPVSGTFTGLPGDFVDLSVDVVAKAEPPPTG